MAIKLLYRYLASSNTNFNFLINNPFTDNFMCQFSSFFCLFYKYKCSINNNKINKNKVNKISVINLK